MVSTTANNGAASTTHAAGRDEESLVPDARAQLTPAQMVERRFVDMLSTSTMMVSHLQSVVRRRPQ